MIFFIFPFSFFVFAFPYDIAVFFDLLEDLVTTPPQSIPLLLYVDTFLAVDNYC